MISVDEKHLCLATSSTYYYYFFQAGTRNLRKLTLKTGTPSALRTTPAPSCITEGMLSAETDNRQSSTGRSKFSLIFFGGVHTSCSFYNQKFTATNNNLPKKIQLRLVKPSFQLQRLDK